MKPITKIFCGLLVLFLGFLTWELYPSIAAVVTHKTHQGLLSAILLNTDQPANRALYTTSSGGGEQITLTGVILLVLIGALLVCLTFMKPGTTGSHGTAKNATRRDMRNFRPRRSFAFVQAPVAPRAVAAYQPPRKQRQVEQRLLLGRYQGRDISLSQEQQQQYVLLTAMIGMGKTAGPIMRNLLREQGLRSLFITDAKGELVPLTAGWLSQFYQVIVFAPLDASQSDGYNPLKHVNSAQDAMQLSQCWAYNTGGGEGHGADAKFWMSMVIRALNACILHLRATEPDAPFSRLAQLLSQHTYEEFKRVLLATKSAKAKAEAVAFFDGMDRNDKLIAGMMADLGNRFQLFLDDEACQTTSYNSIDFKAMAERPIAFYLVIPTYGAELCAPLFATLIMQMWTEWEIRARKEPDRKLPLPVQCYMDEFANLGKIYQLSTHFTTMRSMRIGLFIVLQSFSQIKDLYGEPMRNVMLTNCGTHLLLPGAGLEECEYYSRRIGDTTVQTTAQTVTGGDLFGGGQRSYTTSETRRRLYTPEELRTMSQNEMLVLPARHAPMIVKTIPYDHDREVRDRANLPFVHATVRPEPPDPFGPSGPAAGPGEQLPGPGGPAQAGGNTGRVVNANPDEDDDDSWPGYAPE